MLPTNHSEEKVDRWPEQFQARLHRYQWRINRLRKWRWLARNRRYYFVGYRRSNNLEVRWVCDIRQTAPHGGYSHVASMSWPVDTQFD